MSTPAVIVELVERFRLHKEAYQASSYNETQVRREFIDPFFKALGWDIDNEQGYAEAYKDVVHEDESDKRRLRLKQTILRDKVWELVASAYGLSDKERSFIAANG